MTAQASIARVADIVEVSEVTGLPPVAIRMPFIPCPGCGVDLRGPCARGCPIAAEAAEHGW